MNTRILSQPEIMLKNNLIRPSKTHFLRYESMSKLYIKETIKKDVDGEPLVLVEVSESKIQPLSYIVFLEK